MIRAAGACFRSGRAYVPMLGLMLVGCVPLGKRTSEATSLRRAPEHLAVSIAALGGRGAQRAFQVGPGSAVWNGESAVSWRLGSEAGEVRVSPVWFEDDGVPVAHWEMVSPCESVAFEAAAVPSPALGDSSLEMSVRATLTWKGSGAARCSLWTLVRGATPDVGVRAWDAAAPGGLAWGEGARAMRAGACLAFLPEGVAREGAADSLRAVATRELPSGGRTSWTFTIPAYALAPGAAFLPRPHDAVVARARREWRAWLAGGARLSTGVDRYDALERAARVTLIECQERTADGMAPIGNPFQYRDTWLRDGARALRALALCGYTDMARECARVFLRFQWPSGAFLSQRGQLDGTGQALWALEQVASHPPDAALARAWLPAARRGVAWLREQCRQTRARHAEWPGLLPFGDPHDGEDVRAPLVGNDAWAIAGEEAAARLAMRAGDSGAARDCSDAAREHRAAFATALERVPGDDIPPSWPGPGREWGNYAVAFPTAALRATNPRVVAMVARVHARGSGFLTYDPIGMHGYVGADLAMTALLAGQGEMAREYLDSLLAHSSSTLGQAELFDRQGRFGTDLPPHATAAAAVVELTHALLAVESGDTLLLGAGLDTAMWAGARLDGAPTRFGVLQVTFSRPDQNRMRVLWRGVNAPVRVHVPREVEIVGLERNGAREEGNGDVLASAGAHEVTVRVRLRTAREVIR